MTDYLLGLLLFMIMFGLSALAVLVIAMWGLLFRGEKK